MGIGYAASDDSFASDIALVSLPAAGSFWGAFVGAITGIFMKEPPSLHAEGDEKEGHTWKREDVRHAREGSRLYGAPQLRSEVTKISLFWPRAHFFSHSKRKPLDYNFSLRQAKTDIA